MVISAILLFGVKFCQIPVLCKTGSLHTHSITHYKVDDHPSVWYIFKKMNIDKETGSIVQSNLIKRSNLCLEICVCSVVSTVEPSGTSGKWGTFIAVFDMQ